MELAARLLQLIAYVWRAYRQTLTLEQVRVSTPTLALALAFLPPPSPKAN